MGGGEQHLPVDIEELHNLAVENEEETYIDPHTGFMVFTAYSHWKRGKCCGNACRHCPWGHVNVRKRRKPSPTTTTTTTPSYKPPSSASCPSSLVNTPPRSPVSCPPNPSCSPHRLLF